DGKVFIAGSFQSVRSDSTADPKPRNCFARLNADGTVDDTFTVGFTGGVGSVNGVALLPEGKFVVWGDFTLVRTNGGANFVSRSQLACFNADGTLDDSI